MASNDIDDIDQGYDETIGRLQEINDDEPNVTVGVHAEDNAEHPGYDEEGGKKHPRMAKLLMWHEFGLGNNPERSVLREAVDQNRDRYGRIQEKALGLVVDGRLSMHSAMGMLGEAIKGDVQSRFGDKSELKPLAESTIREKSTSAGRGDAPLIDEGHLQDAIDYKVHGTKGV